MRNKKLVFLLSLTTALVYADAYSTLLQRYEVQIKQQERQLKTLRKNLFVKEQEAKIWQQKEEASKAQWTEAGLAVQRARRMVKGFQGKRNYTHTLAEAAQWSVVERTYLGNAADEQMTYWVTELYKQQKAPSYFADLTPEQSGPGLIAVQLADLSQATHAMADQARQQEASLRMEELRWQNEEQQQTLALDNFRHQQQTLWLHWQEAQQKRASLEEERVQLEQSAQALRVMVEELHQHRDETLASRSDTPRAFAALNALKGTLPWPVSGTVTQNFGKQYSEKLQQLVVSNGIKLETETGKSVRAVQAGKVLFARPFQQYGELVIVQHQHGLTSVYGELGQTRVKEGDVVSALDAVGTVGESRSFYFELRQDEEPINPLVWLAPQHTSELSTRRKYQ
jgi:septal ring factor EnvC (AmiA/AmiB activator)